MPFVPAVDRALQILELLVEEREPLTLTGIADRAGIPPASCHSILHTLEHRGYATRRIVGRSHFWEPTLALYHLGATLANRVTLADVATPHLRELATQVGAPAHAGVLFGDKVMYLAKAPAPGFVQFDTYPGKLSPFHTTALGKAVAAFLDGDEADRLTAGLAQEVKDDLAATRERGFALEDGEEVEGVGCVAAPVRGADGRVVGSVGITAFSGDLFQDGGIPVEGVVVDAADRISHELGHKVRAPA